MTTPAQDQKTKRTVAEDSDESGIPALYTYFGQFVDHDITFDPHTRLQKENDLHAFMDFRTPALDLDSVYGRGPKDQPYLYTRPFGNGLAQRFLLGAPINLGHFGARDLPRNNDNPARALIGDPRNDENVILSQLHGLFLRFHNRLARTLARRTDSAGEVKQYARDFGEVQQEVRFHYQHIVLYDFLEKIIHPSVLASFKSGKTYNSSAITFFLDPTTPGAQDSSGRSEQTPYKDVEVFAFPFMPVEFSAAAFRFGHSMIRQDYVLNPNTPARPIVSFIRTDSEPETQPDLIGFRRLDPNLGIDWGVLINSDRRSYYDTSKRLQFALRIDTSLVDVLGNLPTILAPDNPDSLAQRNLVRGYEIGLPSGQAVARLMRDKGVIKDADILKDHEILIGSTKKKITDIHSTFKDNCPLWTYILAEAMKYREQIKLPVVERGKTVDTPLLGPVGGRIVAEVILGLMFADKTSVLHHPEWQPTAFHDPNHTSEHYTLADFAAYASRDMEFPITRKASG